MATRKSSRVGISSKGASTNNMGGSDAGTSAIPPNSFAILNTINDDDLASIADDCDVVLGGIPWPLPIL